MGTEPKQQQRLKVNLAEVEELISRIVVDSQRGSTEASSPESPKEDVPPEDNGDIAKYGGPSSKFVTTLVNDFFPDMKNTVSDRMKENPVAKLALGSVCSEALSDRSDVLVDKKETNAFFECGSTIALAVLAMRNSFPNAEVVDRQIELATNSALVQTALYGLGESIPRLLYGDRWLNAKKYLGFFPIRPNTIGRALDSHASISDRNQARSELQEAWQEMCRDGAKFRVSFVTASRFHFVSGPYVGSVDNSFLKYAYYSSGRDLRVLLDGSKIILNENLHDEWGKTQCHGSFHGLIAEDALAEYIKILFPGASTREQERLMQAADDAAHRNPQTAVSLPPVFVRQGEGRSENQQQFTEEITAVSSWPDCIKQVLSRKNGNVSIYVSQPDGCVGFEASLDEAIEEANVCLWKLRSRLRIEKVERKEVFVHKPTRKLLETNIGGDCEVVPVWCCTYIERGSEPKRTGNLRSRSRSNQLT